MWTLEERQELELSLLAEPSSRPTSPGQAQLFQDFPGEQPLPQTHSVHALPQAGPAPVLSPPTASWVCLCLVTYLPTLYWPGWVYAFPSE